MHVKPSAIRDVVEKYDDFGYEMRVGHVIRSVPAIEVRHGGTYTDSVTGKPRQYDYRCYLRKEAQCLSLAVECKNLSPAAPLVVCGRKREANESFHELVDSRRGHFKYHAGFIQGLSSVTRRAANADSIYIPGDFVGKSLLRIQTDKKEMTVSNDSDVYDKWAQALSSAVDVAEFACIVNKQSNLVHNFTAILPVVVVPDGLLWRIVYDENGSITVDPELVAESELYVGRRIKIGHAKLPQWFSFSHVHFFTISGFHSFHSKMAVNDHAWNQLLTDKALEV